ncbi:MAG: twin-arginine translocation signal domain-containing protein [Flammeovirgaceae bacterium]|nr:twin-arginine translocation signal domain-containing protein [Flammeovirgaceae bacterium]
MPSAKVSRRDFIKTIGLASATFTIVPRFVLGGKNFLEFSCKQ